MHAYVDTPWEAPVGRGRRQCVGRPFTSTLTEGGTQGLGFLETSQVMIYFSNTDSLLPFHTGSSVLLQGQEKQREKEWSESKIKAVSLDAQLKLCKMPTLANSISF